MTAQQRYYRNTMTDEQKLMARQATRRYKQSAKGRRQLQVYCVGRRKRIEDLKTGPCVDCGNTFPPECMDFDHVRGRKDKNVGSMFTYSIQKIQQEVAKCELVCANCHRIRTRKRALN